MQCACVQLSRKTWILLSLIMMTLASLLSIARYLLLAILCFIAAAIVLITLTTVPGPTSLVHVFATSVALCNLGISFLNRCLVAYYQSARVITNAFITGMKGFRNLCLWNLRSRQSTFSRLASAYSMAHTPLCQKTLSEQYSDL